MKPSLPALLLAAALAACPACDRRQASAAAAPVAPREIALAECAACGMVVGEQPAPRGQVLYRDGQRFFFCSVGDMVHHLQAPSPHGEALGVWVERMDPADPVATPEAEARAWLPAGEAFFVLGLSRPGVMGPAVMSYPSAQDAGRVAAEHGAKVKRWRELRAAITGERPEETR